MANDKKYFSSVLIFGEMLYKYFYFLYKPFYFLYKSVSEKHELEIIKKFIKPNNTVIDIGANIGFYAIQLSKFVGKNGKIIAFEPDTLNYLRLKKNCSNYKNIQCLNFAVGTNKGILKLYKSVLNVDHRLYPSENYTNYEEINVISIDEYLNENKIIPNWIKIDVQGFELSVIKGMRHSLINNNISIVSEFWPYGLQSSNTNINDYINELQIIGLKNIYLIEDTALKQIDFEYLKTLMQTSLPKQYYTLILSKQTIE